MQLVISQLFPSFARMLIFYPLGSQSHLDPAQNLQQLQELVRL